MAEPLIIALLFVTASMLLPQFAPCIQPSCVNKQVCGGGGRRPLLSQRPGLFSCSLRAMPLSFSVVRSRLTQHVSAGFESESEHKLLAVLGHGHICMPLHHRWLAADIQLSRFTLLRYASERRSRPLLTVFVTAIAW